jgi:general secretion pathway protein A
MLKEFYGFLEDPFNLNSDSRFFFLTQHHKKVLDSIVYGITERREFILLTGETGMGKTTLIHQLLQTLEPNIKAIPVYQPPKAFAELLEVILQNLKLPLGERSEKTMWSKFIEYISLGAAQDENLVIIVDEAQELSKEVMEELRLLCNPHPGRLQEVFVGQPAIEDKLNSWDLRQLKQRFAIRCRLRPLNEEESWQFIEHRLSTVGSEISEIFTPEALSLICHYAEGIPLTINFLCTKALEAGYSHSKKPIDSSIVKEILKNAAILIPEEANALPPGERPKTQLPTPYVKRTAFPRSISYALLPLVCLVLIIFFGGTSLKAPMEKITSQFWIQLLEVKERVVSPFLAMKPDFAMRVRPAPVLEEKPVAAPPQLAPKSPVIAQAPMPKLSGQAQLLEKTLSSPSPDIKLREPASKLTQPSAVSQASQVPREPRARIMSVVAVQEGDSLYTLLEKYYNAANTTLVDCVLTLNPEVTNPHRLLVNQKIKLPVITEDSLILGNLGGTFKIQLGTFLKPEYIGFLRGAPALEGKEIEIISRKVPSGETWYRAIAGTFETREEGLKIIHDLKAKGLSPFFSGFQKDKP